MTTLRFVDAAFAGSISGGPYDGVCFYIGGDAYRVWPKAEVNGMPERYRLPVWVRSNPGAVSASSDAQACLNALRAYGTPKGSLVALDSETAVDPAWVRVFVDDVNAGGYPVIDYGSQSTVHGNHNPDGYYWGADWTDVPHLHSGDGMTQYVSFSGYDESLASSSLPFWDTRPGPHPNPGPRPGPVPFWQEAMMQALPTLQQGSADTVGHLYEVHRVQALVACIGTINNLGPVTQLKQDGSYGPATAAGVKAVQGHYGLTQDGVCGPLTWQALVAG
jgi:peptidoglycan hydrolase-like protein with peptidoglycan-binding domain